MTCPKCDAGTIVTVVLKSTHEPASLCRFCGTLWRTHEEIKPGTGHYFHVYSNGNVLEYLLEDAENLDQEHRDLMYSNWT